MLRIGMMVLGLVALIVLLASTGAGAQEIGEEAATGSASRLFDHFVVRGGLITWFILIPLSIATIALIVEHGLSIRRGTVVPQMTLQRIRADLDSKRYVDAVRYTAEDPSVLATAVNAGFVQAHNGYDAMQQAMTEAIDDSAGRLMRKIEYLNVIGNVSPMIGLFGTVYGMIGLFASIREAGGIPEPARIADNISIALVTTFWGLLVAIPALSVFAFFRNRIEELTNECSAAAEKLLASFEPARNGESVTPVREKQAV